MATFAAAAGARGPARGRCDQSETALGSGGRGSKARASVARRLRCVNRCPGRRRRGLVNLLADLCHAAGAGHARRLAGANARPASMPTPTAVHCAGTPGAPVAQLDRASAFEAAGRGFEPLRAHHPSVQPSPAVGLFPADHTPRERTESDPCGRPLGRACRVATTLMGHRGIVPPTGSFAACVRSAVSSPSSNRAPVPASALRKPAPLRM